MSTPRRCVRDKVERDALIEQYLPLVRHVIGRLTFSLPPNIDRDDLYSAGIVGLIRAAETWEEAKGASFKTFAFTAIRGAVLDELRRCDPISRTVRERIRTLENESHRLTAELCRTPTHEELCERLSCSRKQLDHDMQALHLAVQLSIDHSANESDAPVLAGLLVDAAGPPEAEIEQREELELAYKAIGRLPEQARRAVVLYYTEGLLLKEIGGLLGVSESRVSQILSQALFSLRLATQSKEDARCQSV